MRSKYHFGLGEEIGKDVGTLETNETVEG